MDPNRPEHIQLKKEMKETHGPAIQAIKKQSEVASKVAKIMAFDPRILVLFKEIKDNAEYAISEVEKNNTKLAGLPVPLVDKDLDKVVGQALWDTAETEDAYDLSTGWINARNILKISHELLELFDPVQSSARQELGELVNLFGDYNDFRSDDDE